MKISFQDVLSVFFIINAFISITVIILERRRPEKTIAWLLILAVLPPVGLFLYAFGGKNWKKARLDKDNNIITLSLKKEYRIDPVKTDYPSIVRLLSTNADSPLFENNEVTIFKNGEEKFEALIGEIKKATHHIHLEYYIVRNDNIGRKIMELLIKKAKEGVEVRFILDEVGSIELRSSDYIKELKEAGVDIQIYSYFLKPVARILNTQLNYRNHRKCVVVDGKVGFIGGMNIGDEYLGKGKLGFWRDTHIMVRGEFVLGLQAAFLDDFYRIKKLTQEPLIYDKNYLNYFPSQEDYRKIPMQLLKSGPDSNNPAILQGILKMISMAKDHIYITSPYFVPTESVMTALKIAAMSGIDVRILFPGKYDHFFVYCASKTYLAELVHYGIKIYAYDPEAFIHSKVITVDGKLTSIGTANMDIRSYELNYEMNAVIYDEEVSEDFEKLFMEDIKKSLKVDRAYFEEGPFIKKYTEAVARIFSNLL